jgi:hypothetical protein
VHNIQIDLGFLASGKVVLAYPDWTISRSTLFYATIPDLALQKPGKDSTLVNVAVDDQNVAGLKTQLVPREGVFDILYMASHGGLLYYATPSPEGWKRTQLTGNVANIAAAPLITGVLGVALEIGKVDGLGEGQLHYGERDANGIFSQFLIDENRPVGQYLAIAASKNGGRAAIAYYDGTKKGLKVARIP